ncbi:MAG: hypothetical protein PF692_00760 [Kiritimatiellae bacterium]|jgi:hypothetical protein|nr:hypothetical protein [Kiritimatiellia bacterium]
MNSYYSKPITIIALIQVAIILLGMGAASVALRIYREVELSHYLRNSTNIVMNQGFFLVLIPITWTIITAYINSNEKYSEKTKVIFVWSGVAIAIILGIFIFKPTLFMLFRFCSMGGGGIS